MELKETAFQYNVTTAKHSNSDWGAEIGQGKKKLMNVEGFSEILAGMLYYKVDDYNRITANLGKGNQTLKPLGDYAPETSIVLASVFERIMVNGEELPGAKFIMFIIKDERTQNGKGGDNIQYLRRSLKFPDKAQFDGIPYNKRCIEAISAKLGCTPEGSWVVTDMNFVDDALAFTAIVIDKGHPYDFANPTERSEALKRIKYKAAMKFFKASQYDGNLSSVIFYGPPGTGKTHKMQTEFISKFEDDDRFITTFHQSFSYEEFVEGLKPVLNDTDEENSEIKYQIVDGIFKEACERAAQIAGYFSLSDCISDSFENRSAKFAKAKEDNMLVLLCIDEINRGNIAAIFGDLISLIEDSKRLGVNKDTEMVVSLPYSQKKFGVPANLLIVGTMNTADRSIQLLDSALRRRFDFVELQPNYNVFDIKTDDDNVNKARNNAKVILQTINGRIKSLLSKDNQIGHSYFINVKNEVDIVKAIVNKIIPLLEEYFYNDIEKVRFVLNETKVTDNCFYIKDKEASDAYAIYQSSADINDESKTFYKLNGDLQDAINTNNEDKCRDFLQNLLEK